jgi:hypothetical protein
MSNLGTLEEKKFLKTWKLCSSFFTKILSIRHIPIKTFVAKWRKFTELFCIISMVHVVFFFFLILLLFFILWSNFAWYYIMWCTWQRFSIFVCGFQLFSWSTIFSLFHFPLKISLTAHFFLTFTYFIIFAGFQLSQNSHFLWPLFFYIRPILKVTLCFTPIPSFSGFRKVRKFD